MFEKWTNRSFEPSSGEMKPYPLLSLNHFTVPVAIDETPPLHELTNKQEGARANPDSLWFDAGTVAGDYSASARSAWTSSGRVNMPRLPSSALGHSATGRSQ